MEVNCWACELANGDPEQFHPSHAPQDFSPRWYWLVPNEGIVCKDMNDKGYAMRLLYVPCWHLPCGKEFPSDHLDAKAILTDVVRKCLPGYRIVKIDLDNHSFSSHWHAQACLEKNGKTDNSLMWS